jgi:cytochrome c oxidase assembly protein subunit 15
VKTLAVAILLAVIVQGLLGGLRVVRDAETAALVHGSLAALVFSMMGSLVLVTSRWWFAEAHTSGGVISRSLKPLALLAPPVIFTQYVLGGFLRHLGTALYEHIGFAVLALLLVLATVVTAHRTKVSSLRRSAYVLLAVALAQVSIGVGSYITKFGLQSLGYVAVYQSLPQVAFRTSHTVVGVLLLMTSVVFALRVLRVEHLSQESRLSHEKEHAHGSWAWHPATAPEPSRGGAR